MKQTIKILLFITFSLITLSLNAQCYQSNMTQGKTAFNSGKYSSALTFFSNAKKCSDCTDQTEANSWIKKTKNQKAYNYNFTKGKNYYNSGNYSSAKTYFQNAKNYKNTNDVRNWITKTDNAINVPDNNQNNGNMPNNMVLVQGGTFQMGSNNGEDDEQPVHSVTVSSFYMGKYEVTFAEYDKFCDATGHSKPDDEGWGRGNRPVINVSWNDATAYCKWLSKKTGQTYRLPTEAEWEYAAGGGQNSPLTKGAGGIIKLTKWAGTNSESSLNPYAWYSSNSGSKTHPVGTKLPNELGIYDMSGNVWEWCSDWFKGYPGSSGVSDYTGSSRVLRGGSWNYYAYGCRVAYRNSFSPTFSRNNSGFRIARSL